MDMETKAPWYLLGLDRVGLINDIPLIVHRAKTSMPSI